MRALRKVLLASVCVVALFGGSAFDGHGATKSAKRASGVNYTYCNMYSEGQTCKSPWGPNYAAYVTNGSGSGDSSVYCFAHHPDGSWTGGVIYVYGGETKSLWPSGYNQVVCVANTGPGAYPISIRTYQ